MSQMPASEALVKLGDEICYLARESETRLTKKQQSEIADRIVPLIGPGEWQPTAQQMAAMTYEQLTNRAAQSIARMHMAIAVFREYLGEEVVSESAH